jgi:hypothetical protein
LQIVGARYQIIQERIETGGIRRIHFRIRGSKRSGVQGAVNLRCGKRHTRIGEHDAA